MNATEKAMAIVEVCKAVIQTVQEAKSVPAGTVYAALMVQGCSLSQFDQIISLCVDAGKIRKNGDLLVAA